ncbi:MAG: dephospho-CoA kinase [Alphaproteobacteria bacterium]|nr:dephospho-CoA kinase [Alphaproteobacteria bacterium]
MITIGLTGGIGMGKSTIARQCALLGAKTLNSDDVVHRLMSPGGKAFAKVSENFPQVVAAGKIDRKKLGEIVFADDKKLTILEAILHPLVIAEEEKFARAMKNKGARILVLDIPLLFETGGERRMDLTLVATAPAFIQAQRVLARPHMTREKLAAIRARQMPDAEKRKRADGIVHTGLGKAASMRMLKGFLGRWVSKSLG